MGHHCTAARREGGRGAAALAARIDVAAVGDPRLKARDVLHHIRLVVGEGRGEPVEPVMQGGDRQIVDRRVVVDVHPLLPARGVAALEARGAKLREVLAHLVPGRGRPRETRLGEALLVVPEDRRRDTERQRQELHVLGAVIVQHRLDVVVPVDLVALGRQQVLHRIDRARQQHALRALADHDQQVRALVRAEAGDRGIEGLVVGAAPRSHDLVGALGVVEAVDLLLQRIVDGTERRMPELDLDRCGGRNRGRESGDHACEGAEQSSSHDGFLLHQGRTWRPLDETCMPVRSRAFEMMRHDSIFCA